MTGPAPAWTGTPPTSWPRSSPEQPASTSLRIPDQSGRTTAARLIWELNLQSEMSLFVAITGDREPPFAAAMRQSASHLVQHPNGVICTHDRPALQ